MLKNNTKTIAKLFNTTCKNVDFTGVSIDSRNCSGNLFIAIIGDKFNAHNFIQNAIQNGCVAIVASEKHAFDVPTIYVDDTTFALGEIAQYHRLQINPKVIAITGSNGKTTTKNMLFNIFNLIAPTLKTAGNLNNQYGVPLTLLNLEPKHQFAIIEMGANHLGEIRYLRNIAKPDIACVINTLDAHIGEFGGKENLIKAKGEIYAKTINVVNTNTHFKGDISFGSEGDIDYDYLKNIELQLLGKHNQENALAAVAIAKSCAISDKIIKQGLEQTLAENGRLQIIKTAQLTLIDDCYNASPTSTQYALKVLEDCTGIKIAVLGNMAELGDKSNEFHIKIGEYAKRLDIDYLFSIGDKAKNYGFEHFENEKTLINRLQKFNNATVLLKASRTAQLENIISKI